MNKIQKVSQHTTPPQTVLGMVCEAVVCVTNWDARGTIVLKTATLPSIMLLESMI